MLGKIAGISLAFVGLLTAQTTYAAWEHNKSIGGFSNVHVYTPDTLAHNGKHGLMVVLHGCGMSSEHMKNANLDVAADATGVVMAAPKVTDGGGMTGDCWKYWSDGVFHSRTAGDHKRILDMVSSLVANPAYNIDPKQVYITGISSGGAFAHVTGCLAPDVFAGVSSFAGPSPGTTSNDAFSFKNSDVERECRNLAGSYASHFDTQVAHMAQGEGTSAYVTTDGLVPTAYLPQNASGMAKLYGASLSDSGTAQIQGHSINYRKWDDALQTRVEEVSIPGFGHAWPGGSGASGSYVDASSINYGTYLAQFFSENNPRISVETPAFAVDSLNVTGSSCNISVSGSVAILESGAQVNQVEITADDKTVVVIPDSNGQFSATLTVGTNYTHSVVAIAYGQNSDGIELTAVRSTSITLGTPYVPPSWCQYQPPENLQYLPDCQEQGPQQCGDTTNPTTPSWCTPYLAQYIAACR